MLLGTPYWHTVAGPAVMMTTLSADRLPSNPPPPEEQCSESLYALLAIISHIYSLLKANVEALPISAKTSPHFLHHHPRARLRYLTALTCLNQARG